jgi:dehydrogenase/reductase SDR family protein 12
MASGLRDTLAELTVVASYGRRGYERRAEAFAPIAADLSGRVIVVTGANSGIGFAATAELARLGATVVMACRSPSRGQKARTDLLRVLPDARLHLEQVDVSDLRDVRRFCDAVLTRFDAIDVLAHNAGVMVDDLARTAAGHELTFATNVLGGFLMTHLLADALAARAPSRVLHVTSGGMYTQKLDLRVLRGEVRRFDGVRAYAQTKRAQVILNEMWAERLTPRGVVSNAMHPGWADTPGVERSMPGFYRVMGGELRTPAQGADTLVWLAASDEAASHTGQLWLDREPRHTYVLPFTRESQSDRERLWTMCCEACDIDPSAA